MNRKTPVQRGIGRTSRAGPSGPRHSRARHRAAKSRHLSNIEDLERALRRRSRDPALALRAAREVLDRLGIGAKFDAGRVRSFSPPAMWQIVGDSRLNTP